MSDIPGHDPVGAAEAFVHDHDRHVRPRSVVAARAQWDLAITGDGEHALRKEEAELELRRHFADHGRHHRIRHFDRVLGTRAGATRELRRQIRLLKLAYTEGHVDPITLQDQVHLETEVANRFNQYRGTLDGRLVDDNEIRRVLAREDSVARRREAWEASRSIGPEVAPLVLDLVRLRNEAARSQGFRDFWSLHLEVSELDEDWLDAFLHRLDELTANPFRTLKGSLDQRLIRRFGVSPSELMPWHYPDPWFAEALEHEAGEFETAFEDLDLVEVTRRTFERIGLDVDDSIERSDLDARPGKCQHAFCLNVDRAGDVRVLANLAPVPYWVGTMLHEFGHAAYDLYIDRSLPFLLRCPAHTFTTEAAAMLFGRLLHDGDWLREDAGFSEERVHSIAPALDRKARASRLIFARWALTFVRFERDLYRNPDGDLVARWWDGVEKTQGLRRPRRRDQADWAAKIHLAAFPVYYQNYLLGETFASQLTAAIRRRSGRGLAGNPEAGRFLREEVFRHGALLRWDELVEQATGETLSAEWYLA